MANICTVLTGDGSKYKADDVNKLYHALKKHTTKPFKFYCLSDHSGFWKDIIKIPITKQDRKLQWHKLTYFKKNIIDGEDIILMDIDQVVTRNCDFLFEPITNKEFRKGITSGPVNGEQHFVQKMLEDNKTNVSMFPEKYIVKWHKDDFYIQTCIEHDYKKWSGNKYLLDEDWHEDVKVIHYAGN